ncbi:MAG: hypothetical protein V1867_08185 [Candidatus Falkowbacteria bacterium]
MTIDELTKATENSIKMAKEIWLRAVGTSVPDEGDKMAIGQLASVLLQDHLAQQRQQLDSKYSLMGQGMP